MTWATIIAVAYFIAYNCYFGWNLAAQSDAEIICDGISMIAFVMIFMGREK